MIQISNLSKSYADQVLFEDVTFPINSGERIGLIGRNGHGKTTLFRMLAGIEDSDSGEIHFPAGYKVGHLSQHLNFSEANVLDEAAVVLPLLEGGWKETYLAETILQGLGFSQDDFTADPNSLSGGFQVRLDLAKLILSEPNLLLLDEPTNYLDIISLRWLNNFMRSWQGELILITHDHGFMDDVSTHTLGIHRNNVRKIAGGTKKYYAQLEMEEEVHEQSRLNQEKKREEAEKFIKTFRAKASKAKAVQSRIKALEKMESFDKLEDIKNLDFQFTHKDFPSKRLFEAKNISFKYPDSDELLIKDFSISVGAKDRIGVIGKNGKGKSTLLKLMVGELEPVEGEVVRSPNLDTAYFGQTNVERLNPNMTIEQEMVSVTPTKNRTIARTVAGQMMFQGDAALKEVRVLSGGEKSRVLLGKLLLTPANLLVLDEPTNHLDMQSTDCLLTAADEFPGGIVIVSHSEMFLRKLATRLIVFDRGQVDVFEGSYDDFLKRVGWQEEEDEEDLDTKPETKEKQLSKKELRRLRAQEKLKQTEAYGHLEKEAARIEQRIETLEKQVEEQTQTLIEITKDGFGEDGQKLSKELHSAKEEISSLFEELEKVTKELEGKKSTE